jgi:hypothetical protein
MFTYTLKGNTLTKDEAAALVEASASTPIQIELSSILNLRKVDSAKLFKLSVEKKLPELASLAWKISVNDAPKAQAKQSAPVEIVTIRKAPEKLLEDLHRTNGLWTAGAAMILSSCSNDHWWTLRQVATYWVNNLEVSPRSVLFQGFSVMNGSWEPKELRAGINRRETFHVSPVYICLRDALKWLMENELIERTKKISQGSNLKDASAQVQAMSRVYYACKLTDRGRELVELWGDIDTFIQSAFQSRLR